MTVYRYRAADRDGNLTAGEREAESRDAVVRWLQERRLVPLAVETGAAAAAATTTVKSVAHLPPARHLAFLRKLATLIEAELPLEEALSLIASLDGDAREKTVVNGLLDRLRSGEPLSAAMAALGCFPADQVALVKAGEAGGSLGVALVRLAAALERSHALRERVRSALIYPAILAAAAVGSVVLMMTVVVPAFEPMFADAGRTPPPATRFLLDLAAAMRVWTAPGLALLGALWLLFARVRRLPAAAARLDGWLLRLPVVGELAARLEAARFARTLGTLLSNGAPLLVGLELAQGALTNRRLAATAADAAEHLRAGGRLGERLLADPCWPRLSAELTRVGEETGRLPAMLLRTADILEEESGRALERLVALITPAVTLTMGAVVAGVVLALLSAVLAVNDAAI